jgi:hypothetical protein
MARKHCHLCTGTPTLAAVGGYRGCDEELDQIPDESIAQFNLNNKSINPWWSHGSIGLAVFEPMRGVQRLCGRRPRS